jgi:hypothetical protein
MGRNVEVNVSFGGLHEKHEKHAVHAVVTYYPAYNMSARTEWTTLPPTALILLQPINGNREVFSVELLPHNGLCSQAA